MTADRLEGLRILAIPAAHPYVAQALPIEQITLLDDATDPWWPPVAFDPRWMREHGGDADVVHVHFGFEHVEPAVLRRWCDTLVEMHLPLVVTVHDLRNPHLADNAVHLEQLGVLIEAAAGVLTLTDAAAAEIGHRFARVATVVAHPNLVPDEIAAELRADASDRHGVVGIEFGVGRANMLDPAVLLPPVAEAASAAAGSVVVGVRHDAGRLVERICALAEPLGVQVHVEDHLSDGELYRRVAQRQVMVLPYRFGTHSGWLEMCRDVGTRVVAPTCGHYAGQWDDIHSFRCDELHGLDVTDLRNAVRAALGAPPPWMQADQRRFEREHGRRVHLGVYRRVATESTPPAVVAR